MPTTSRKILSASIAPISARELADYRADVKGDLFRQIRKRFRSLQESSGFSQLALAKRLDMDAGLLSRRLKGENDMQIETLSDLARGLECRIDVKLIPLKDVQSGLHNGDFRISSSSTTVGGTDIASQVRPDRLEGVESICR